MSDDKETRIVVLYLCGESDKARKFLTLPVNGKVVWVPRSITHHVTKMPFIPDSGDGTPDKSITHVCNVEIEEWFLDKAGL